MLPTTLITKRKKGPNSEKSGAIKFDLYEENRIRILARKEYDLVKQMRQAGFPVRRMIHASVNEVYQKQFKLPSDTNLIVLELALGKDKAANFVLVNDVKDYLQTQDNFRVVDDIETATEQIPVHRFLVKPIDITKEMILKENLKGEARESQLPKHVRREVEKVEDDI